MATLDTAKNILSLSDLKERLGITSSGDDTILTHLLNDASALANRMTGRHLRDASHTEYYDGDGTRDLILKNAPINSITSIHDDVDRSFTAESAINVSDDVLQETEAGIIRLWNNESKFEKGVGNVKIVYNAGFTLSAMPSDIVMAVTEIIGMWYHRKHKDNAFGVQSKTNAGRSITYLNEAIPLSVKKIFDAWKFGRTPHQVF